MKEKWQSIRGFFRKNSRKLIPLLLLAAILLPIVVDNSYVLGICTKILLYMLLASSVNVINGYSGQFAIGHAGFLCGKIDYNPVYTIYAPQGQMAQIKLLETGTQ